MFVMCMRTYGKVFYKPAKKSSSVICMFIWSGRIANSTEGEVVIVPVLVAGTLFTNGILSLELQIYLLQNFHSTQLDRR
jgi:hypothetical protein